MNPKVGSANHGMVFTVLVILAAVSVGVPFLHLGTVPHNALLFGIAFFMAFLVIMQYMGLKQEGPLVFAFFIVPFVLFAILVALLIPEFVLNHTILTPMEH